MKILINNSTADNRKDSGRDNNNGINGNNCNDDKLVEVINERVFIMFRQLGNLRSDKVAFKFDSGSEPDAHTLKPTFTFKQTH